MFAAGGHVCPIKCPVPCDGLHWPRNHMRDPCRAACPTLMSLHRSSLLARYHATFPFRTLADWARRRLWSGLLAAETGSSQQQLVLKKQPKYSYWHITTMTLPPRSGFTVVKHPDGIHSTPPTLSPFHRYLYLLTSALSPHPTASSDQRTTRSTRAWRSALP